jgi:hypothetical protein
MFSPSVETQGDQSDEGETKIKQRRDNREKERRDRERFTKQF